MKRKFCHVASRMLRSVIKEFQAPSVLFSLFAAVLRTPTILFMLFIISRALSLYRAILER